MPKMFRSALRALVLLLPVGLTASAFAQQPAPFFTPGNLVVVVEGCGVNQGTCTAVPNGTGTGAGNSSSTGYGDNQAAPITLFQFKPNLASSASFVNSLVLPQTGSGANLPIAGEYGSSSEGGLQLSGQGQYLTLGAYGVNAATFNANPTTYGAAPSLALAQSGSLTGQSYTPIPRVITLIDPFGNVNSSTAVFNIFNTNNPRSVYTFNGTTAYMSGQGAGSDATSGVFYIPTLGGVVNAPVPITGLDTSSNAYSQDTRFLTVYNGTLYVSVDTKGGSGNARSFIGTLGTPPATSLYAAGAGPTQIPSANNASPAAAATSTSKIVLTASEANTINVSMIGSKVSFNLSPAGYFFANPYTLYIADTGNPKQNAATNLYGDGGLQKWINTAPDGSGTWQLMYTMSAGLHLVANPSALTSSVSGTTGLYGLAGVVSGDTVYLYATNATIGDLDATYIYGIADPLAQTTNLNIPFTQLAVAPPDSNFKGISFAPSLPAGSATINTVPSGLTVTTSGTGCAPGTYITPATLVWTPGSACTITTASSQTSNATPYVFSQWQDGSTNRSYLVTAPATSASYTATYTNMYQPVGSLDKAVDNTTGSTPVNVGDSLLVSGWVADPVDGAPLTNVKVYVDGAVFGTPTLGIARPDVATTYSNPAYTNSGYQLIASATGLALGTHAVTVIAIDSASKSTTFGPLSINLVATPVVTASSASVVYGGTSTALTATVAYTGTVAPTGGLTFTVNGSSTGVGATTCTGTTSPLTCTATYTPGSLAVGSYPIVATSGATSSYLSAMGSGTLAVTAATPVVTAPSSSITLGTSSTMLTATVAYTGAAAPAGGLSFTVNGSTTGVGTTTCIGTASPLTCTASYASSGLAVGSYPVVATEAANTSYLSATGSGTLTVTAATPTVTATSGSIIFGTSSTTLTATVAYAGTVVPTSAVTFTVNGSSTGVGATTCTGTASPRTCTASYTSSGLAAGSYPIVATEAANSSYLVATGSGTLTVTAATPTVTATSGSIIFGTPSTTLTATVAYTGSAAPAGGLTFAVNGSSTGVGAATCTGTVSPLTCTASYASAGLAVGSYSFTATEAASSNYLAATGSGTLAVTSAPDFSFTTSGTTTQTLAPGGSANFTFALSALFPSYPNTVNFAVTGLPAGATYTLTPTSVSATGGAQTVTLAVKASGSSSANTMPNSPWKPTSLVLAGLCLLPLGFRRKLRSGIARNLTLLLFVCASLAGLVGLAGCSSYPTVNYTVTVTATSGSVQHAAAVNLTVQ